MRNVRTMLFPFNLFALGYQYHIICLSEMWMNAKGLDSKLLRSYFVFCYDRAILNRPNLSIRAEGTPCITLRLSPLNQQVDLVFTVYISSILAILTILGEYGSGEYLNSQVVRKPPKFNFWKTNLESLHSALAINCDLILTCLKSSV